MRIAVDSSAVLDVMTYDPTSGAASCEALRRAALRDGTEEDR